MTTSTQSPAAKVQGVLLSGKEALTPEGLIKICEALQGRPATEAESEQFRQLESERDAGDDGERRRRHATQCILRGSLNQL